jgi:hypothetical protein
MAEVIVSEINAEARRFFTLPSDFESLTLVLVFYVVRNVIL